MIWESDEAERRGYVSRSLVKKSGFHEIPTPCPCRFGPEYGRMCLVPLSRDKDSRVRVLCDNPKNQPKCKFYKQLDADENFAMQIYFVNLRSGDLDAA